MDAVVVAMAWAVMDAGTVTLEVVVDAADVEAAVALVAGKAFLK